MVLAIVGIGVWLGRRAAWAGAIVGGLGFDYFFLPPDGFGIEAPEHWIALGAFLATAGIASHLASLLKRGHREALQRKRDVETLHTLANAMLASSGAEFSLMSLAATLAEVFGAAEAALYDKRTGKIIRAGAGPHTISPEALREAASSGLQFVDPFSRIVSISHGGELLGSMGIAGGQISPSVTSAVAARVGVGLANLDLYHKNTEAEAARRAEELKSAALDAMAHEIRSPLNSIKIAASTLLTDPGDASVRREMLSLIDEEVDRLDHVLDNTVRMARASPSELSLHIAPQRLEGLIGRAIAEMSAAISLRCV